jgi:HAE1 family hydrophobic/amphiphilic exporter-1
MTTFRAVILQTGLSHWNRQSDLPTVDFPTISVGEPVAPAPERWRHGGPPLEKAFSAIAGIDEITSSSNLGRTNITLQFAHDRSVEAAAQDVNAAIGKTLPFLPSTILPPNYHKQNPSAAPILNIALTSNVLPMTDVDEYAETTIAQRLDDRDVAGVNVGVWQ